MIFFENFKVFKKKWKAHLLFYFSWKKFNKKQNLECDLPTKQKRNKDSVNKITVLQNGTFRYSIDFYFYVLAETVSKYRFFSRISKTAVSSN